MGSFTSTSQFVALPFKGKKKNFLETLLVLIKILAMKK